MEQRLAVKQETFLSQLDDALMNRALTKVHMIFDLIDLFNRNPFRLIESNHFLIIDCTFLWKKCIISWILDEIKALFY